MSTAEELLNGVTDGAGSDNYLDEERHIIIHSDRTVSVPECLKTVAVQFDHDVETVTFDCPRYWDRIDMSDLTTRRIYIHYMRADGKVGCYPCPVESVVVDDVDPDIMHFTWTISRNLTEIKGSIKFLVCIRDVTVEGEDVNQAHCWNSKLNTEMIVSEGLDCGAIVTDEYPDVITQLLLRMEAVEEVTDSEWKEQIGNRVSVLETNVGEKLSKSEADNMYATISDLHGTQDTCFDNDQRASAAIEELRTSIDGTNDILYHRFSVVETKIDEKIGSEGGTITGDLRVEGNMTIPNAPDSPEKVTLNEGYSIRQTANGDDIVDGSSTEVKLIRGQTKGVNGSFKRSYIKAIKATGKNLVNFAEIANNTDSVGLTCTKNPDGTFNLRGTLKSLTWSGIYPYTFCSGRQKVYIPAGTKITMQYSASFYGKGTGVNADGALIGNTSVRVSCAFIHNSNPSSYDTYFNDVFNEKYKTYTPETDINEILLQISPYGFADGDYLEINNIKLMLNVGGTALTWEPYTEDIIELPEPLELGQYDSFNPRTGVLARRTGRMTLTGDESYHDYIASDNMVSIMQKHILGTAMGNGIHTGRIASANEMYIALWDIKEAYGSSATVEDVKRRIKQRYTDGTPIEIEYELDTAELTVLDAASIHYNVVRGGLEYVVQGETDNSAHGVYPRIEQEYYISVDPDKAVNKEYVDNGLAMKADKSNVDDRLKDIEGRIADTTYVDEKFTQLSNRISEQGTEMWEMENRFNASIPDVSKLATKSELAAMNTDVDHAKSNVDKILSGETPIPESKIILGDGNIVVDLHCQVQPGGAVYFTNGNTDNPDTLGFVKGGAYLFKAKFGDVNTYDGVVRSGTTRTGIFVVPNSSIDKSFYVLFNDEGARCSVTLTDNILRFSILIKDAKSTTEGIPADGTAAGYISFRKIGEGFD